MGDSWLQTDGGRIDGGAVGQTHIERDPLVELPVPTEALWGIQTERARQNFPISNLRPLPAFVDAVILIKKAAALTHRETGRLDRKLADAIIAAASTSSAAAMIASASLRSRRPVSRWVSAAAFLMRMTASTKAGRGRRLEMGKFCRARSVWMPHSASVGTGSSPRGSRSIRV